MARLQEDKLQDLARASRQQQSPWQPFSRSTPTPSTEVTPTAKSTSGILLVPPAKPRFRHLSVIEMNEKREKGLCFNCDQRWSRSYKCGARVFLMLANEEDISTATGELEQIVPQLDPDDDPPDSTV